MPCSTSKVAPLDLQLETVYRQRGLVPSRGVSYRGIILSQTREDDAYAKFLLNPRHRKLLRKIARLHADGSDVTIKALENVKGKDEALTASLKQLCTWGILRKASDSVYTPLFLAQDFGPTLEWLVAWWFRHEAASPADWGVRLDEAPGGDFDVLAQVGERLLYVECKTGRPDQFGLKDVTHFFHRLVWLAPAYGVLLFDTEEGLDPVIERLSREWDKCVPPDAPNQPRSRLFGEDRFRKWKWDGVWECRVDWFNLANAQPSLERNLRGSLKVAASAPVLTSGQTVGRLGGRTEEDFTWLFQLFS